jgi:hypothetical protein
MKRLTRIVLLLHLLASLSLVTIAQESTEESPLEISVPDDHAQVLVQQATSGTFVAADDGGYLLTLAELGGEFSWFTEAPQLNAGTELLSPVMMGWQAAEELVAQSAVLHTGDVAVVLMLTAPTYDNDEDILTYTATVVEIIPQGDADDKTPPEEFDEATLFIRVDADFMRALIDGMIEAAEGGREFARLTCIMGRCG